VYLEPVRFLKSEESMQRHWPEDQAASYTRWLATHHYENFHVVSFLLPKSLHQDFYNVYAFCRWADDLGDETGSTEKSLELLAWWREGLHAMFGGGEVSHPVYVALRSTAARHGLSVEPFADLITAFVQDQTTPRYANWEEVLGYCRNSANPVGRLVLMLCGYRDEERFRLSDATCTALQLANFWQDVTLDWDKGRVYLPLDLLARYGAVVSDIGSRNATPEFKAAMAEAVDYARRLFKEGLPLARMVDRRLGLDLDLFSRGGMRVLSKIRAQGYDVLRKRPVVGRVERTALLVGSLARMAFRRAA
jgi:squalene synthase HpnC